MIKVAGLEYAVRLSGHASDFSSTDLTGEVDYDECTITILANLTDRKQQQTFIHELTHIILEGESTGSRSVNEKYVTRVSNALYGILVENSLLTPDWWDALVDERPSWTKAPQAAQKQRYGATERQTRGRSRRTDHYRKD